MAHRSVYSYAMHGSRIQARSALPLRLAAAALLCSATVVLALPVDELDPPLSPQAYEPMSDEVREAIGNLVVATTDAATNEAITGTYDEAQAGLVAGADEGRNMGTVTTEVGPVNVRVPIPILQLPGMVYGGLSGAAKKDMQEFRDALVEDIANADSQPLENGSLALDVHRHIWGLPQVDARLFAATNDLPEETDAVLYVGFEDFKMDVQKTQATLILTAKAVIQRHSDGMTLYSRVIEYQDTDTLKNWTANDLALWHDFGNFAAHYLARELAGETFYRALVPSSIEPRASASAKADKKIEHRYVSKTQSPELAWEHVLLDRNPDGTPADPIDAGDIAYDLEIYDAHRLVYASRQIPAQSHVVGIELPCQTYRWSVRPTYYRGDSGNDVTYGDWMRRAPDEAGALKGRNGLIGRNASIAPAYTQDFAELDIRCGKKKR